MSTMTTPLANGSPRKSASSSSLAPSSRDRLPIGWLVVVFLSFNFGWYCSRSVGHVETATALYNNNGQTLQQTAAPEPPALRAPVTREATEVVTSPEAPVQVDTATEQDDEADARSAPPPPPPDTTSATMIENDNDESWGRINVFVGNRKQLDKIPPPTIQASGGHPNAVQKWYGQAQQDRLVHDLLGSKKNGFFLDLAANDARTLSNTFALEKHHGWNGICIEPNPIYWHDLSYRKCHVVAAAVGKNRLEEVQFRFNSIFGGIVNDKFDNKDSQTGKGGTYDKPATPKYTVPLREILHKFNAPKVIDYMNLDVEGAEEYIMSDFPFDEYTITLMTVERPKAGLQELLKANNYKMIGVVSKFKETMWAHESAKLKGSGFFNKRVELFGKTL